MIDTVLWDVDGTLMDFKRSEREALKKALSEHGHTPTEDEILLYSKINDSCWKRYEKGEMSYDDVFTARFRFFFDEIGFGADIESVNAVYRTGLGEIYFLREGALELCQGLKGRVRQYIVTNGFAETQIKKVTNSGLINAVDGIFVSGLIGCPKPEKLFFDRCFEKIGMVDRDKTIIIGDSLTSDMQGGINAGIHTCWYNPDGEENKGVKTDFEITDLSKVPGIIFE